MILGILIRFGVFSFIPVYGAVMLGDLLGDSFWYYVGYKWGHAFIKKFGKYFSITEESTQKIIKIFQRYRNRILVISKVTNGLGFSFITLITAGMAKIPFKKYLTLNLIGQFFWSGILIGTGYFFSNAYLQVNDVLYRVFIVGLFIALVMLFLGFVKYVRDKAENI